MKAELSQVKSSLQAAGDEGAEAVALRVKVRSLEDKIVLLERLMEEGKTRQDSTIESKELLIRNLEREVASSAAQIDKLQGQLASLENELSTVNAELDVRRGDHGSQHEVMKRRLSDYEDKMAGLRSEVEGLKGQRDDYETAISSLEETNAALSSQVKALSLSSSEARGRLVDLQQLVHRQEQQLESLQGPTSSHARVRDLEASVYRAQQQMSSLQGELASVSEERAVLVEELREREEELMGAEGKISVLRAEVNRLTNFDHAFS